jgi:hypothetical protein
MPKQPAPPRPGEPPQPQPPGPDMPPIKELPARPDLEPVDPPQGEPAPRRVSVRPSARQEGPARRPDRYDMIGAAIVVFIIALWVVHFLLPAPPPDVP